MDLADRYEISKIILISPHQRITLNRYILQNSEDELVRWKNHIGEKWSELVPPSRDAEICTSLFLILWSTGVNVRELLEGKNEPKITAERIDYLMENAPWTNPSKVDECLKRIVSDIFGAELRVINVDKPKKDELDNMRSEVEKKHCPNERCKRFRAGKGIDQEDLSLAVQVSRSGIDGIYIFSIGECFSCISKYLKEEGKLRAHLEVIS